MNRWTRRDGPWLAPDHLGVVAVNVVCLLAIVVCWVATALHDTWHPQLKWLQGAIVAAVVVCVADAMWLLQGMRQLRTRRRDLLTAGSLWSPRRSSGGSDVATARYVAGPRMTMYHTPQCLLAAHKAELMSATAEEHARAGRTPCRMCLL